MTAETKLKFLCDIHRVAVRSMWSLGDLIVLSSSIFGLAAAAGLWAAGFLKLWGRSSGETGLTMST